MFQRTRKRCRTIKEYAKKFYKSKAWEKCRASFIATLKDKTCPRCNINPGKIVHHKQEITPDNINDPMITLNFLNLEYVCQDCHNIEHHAQKSIKPGLEFDKDGNLIKKISPPKKN